MIVPGAIGAGDAIHLVHRPFPEWPLSRLLALPLVPEWRKVIARRLETGRVEDWRPRTEEPI